jgi:hypothetical protein
MTAAKDIINTAPMTDIDTKAVFGTDMMVALATTNSGLVSIQIFVTIDRCNRLVELLNSEQGTMAIIAGFVVSNDHVIINGDDPTADLEDIMDALIAATFDCTQSRFILVAKWQAQAASKILGMPSMNPIGSVPSASLAVPQATNPK